MKAPEDIHERVASLKSAGEPFAIATVVRTIAVTSAKAGAKAIIMNDGTISAGWIGGGCARAAVLKAAREALEDGVPRLVSIQPEDLLAEHGVSAGEVRDGVKFARNMCPSQGSMDIFVEAIRPRPELVIFGASPVAVALAALAKPLGFSRTICAQETDQSIFPDAESRMNGFSLLTKSNARRFIVVATQGQGDEAALRAALEAGADHVAFVGSLKKAEKLKEKLAASGMDKARLEGFKAPAGLDIKAVTPEEIALSILAEVVQTHRSRGPMPSGLSTANANDERAYRHDEVFL